MSDRAHLQDNPTDLKALINDSINKIATEVAEIADRATKTLMDLIDQKKADRGALGDPVALQEALFSAICREIIDRIVQKLAEKE